MFWNLIQQFQIGHSQNSADDAHLKASIATAKIAELEERLQTLALASQAMWEILSAQKGITENELVEKITEIDLRDGELDGKLRVTTISKCPDCGHQMKTSRPNCFWCGTKLSTSTPFIK